MRLKPSSPERVSGRLTISAARTNVVLLIRRTVRPSGIPASMVAAQPWCLGQFRLSIPAESRWVPAPPANFAHGSTAPPRLEWKTW